MVSDGTNVWVLGEEVGFPANESRLTKLRPSDGAVLGTYGLPISSAGRMLSAAGFLWITAGASVAKVRLSDGVTLATYATQGTAADGMAYDGTYLWVANHGSANISKLRASDGVLMGVYGLPNASQPTDLAIIGTRLYAVGSFQAGGAYTRTISSLNLATGAVLFSSSLGVVPADLDSRSRMFVDGGGVLVIVNNGTVSRFAVNDIAFFDLGSYAVSWASGIVDFVDFDGDYWVSSPDKKIFRIRRTDGTVVAVFERGDDYHVAMAAVGSQLWTVGYTDRKITVLNAAEGSSPEPIELLSSGPGVSVSDTDGTSIFTSVPGADTLVRVGVDLGVVNRSWQTGDQPAGVLVVGSFVWVANSGSDNVMKFRSSDGELMGTYPVGDFPQRLASDGANIWVTNAGSNTVTKLRISDGANQGSFNVGSAPWGIASDGTTVWVSNYLSGNVTRLRASDGEVLGLIPVGAGPSVVKMFGGDLWVLNTNADTVTRVRASDSVTIGTYPTDAKPSDMASDGASVWITHGSNGCLCVTRLRLSDGKRLTILNMSAITYGRSVWTSGISVAAGSPWVAGVTPLAPQTWMTKLGI